MKKLIALLIALAFSACATANDVTLTWNHTPEEYETTAYRLYEVSGGDLILVDEVPGDTNIITITGV